MVSVRLKGIQRVRAKLADGSRVEYHMIRGVPRSTFWKSTSDVAIGSQPYVDAYRAAARPAPVNAETFGGLIDSYLDSGEFRTLSDRTKKDYRRWIDPIRDKFASAPLSAFDDPRIRRTALRWRDQWSGKNADYAWTVLARVVSWGYKTAKVLNEHHLRDVERLYGVDRSEIIWLEHELAAMEEGAPDWVGRLLRAAAETGLRPGDLVTLERRHVMPTPKGRRIQIRTRKRNRLASIPVTPRMAAILDATPLARQVTLVNAEGDPLSVEWASKAVKKWREKLGLRSELRLYDARGSACTRLLRAGASVGEIAVTMGWSVEYAAKMIGIYAAMDPEAADGVLVKLERHRNAK